MLKVGHDIEDYGNALNRLQQQLDKISDAANEELVTMILCYVSIKHLHVECCMHSVHFCSFYERHETGCIVMVPSFCLLSSLVIVKRNCSWENFVYS